MKILKRQFVMMGQVAPGASATPAPGEQKKNSKAPGICGPVIKRGVPKAAGKR